MICGNPDTGRKDGSDSFVDLDARFFLLTCHVQAQNEAFQHAFLTYFVQLGSSLFATCSLVKRNQKERESVGEEDIRSGSVMGRGRGRRKCGHDILYERRI